MSWQGPDPKWQDQLREFLIDHFYAYVQEARGSGRATATRLIRLFGNDAGKSGILGRGVYPTLELSSDLFYEVAERRDGAWNLKAKYSRAPEESVGSNEFVDAEEGEEMDS
jgi:hypothetical protein